MALNFQTGDNPMWLNFWRFRENANMGYVLKPPYLRGICSALKVPLHTRPYSSALTHALKAPYLRGI